MAAPTKPWHFLVAILFYALTWIVVRYAFNVLGNRFGWSSWMGRKFSLGEAIVTGMLWGLGMVGFTTGFEGKRPRRAVD